VAERTGTVEYRSGRWWARPTLADGSRGNRVALPVGATEEQAIAKAKALTELAQRKGITQASVEAQRPPAPPKGPTVTAWGEAWLDERERRGLSSVRTDRGRWSKWIEPKLGALEMAIVPTEDLERFVQFLDEQVSAGALAWKTAKNVWGLVTKAFDDACHSKTLELRVRKDNPATGVRGPDRGAERGKQFLYPSEFLALMGCERVPLRWRVLIAVQIYLYCRAGELEALHVEDVDLAHRSVHIHRAVDRDHDDIKETKTNSPRRIPIEPHLLPLLEQLVAEARAEGRTLLVEMPPLCDLASRLREFLQRAGVERAELFRTTPTSKQITWHDLRATAATWLAIRGVAPQMIMALCGHENMETTMGYVRLAAVLHVDPASVFPPLDLPQSLPQGPKEWGSAGGKLSRSLANARRPQRDSNPLEEHCRVDVQPVSAALNASHPTTSARPSARNVVSGAALGQPAEAGAQGPLGSLARHAVAQEDGGDQEGAAALALVGRQVLAASFEWDDLEAVLWEADPAAATGGPR
jgi:integrase